MNGIRNRIDCFILVYCRHMTVTNAPTTQTLSQLAQTSQFYVLKRFLQFIEDIWYSNKVDVSKITIDNVEWLLGKFRIELGEITTN